MRLRSLSQPPAHRAGRLAVRLDHEQLALVRVASDLVRSERVGVVAARAGEIRPHVLVGVELDEEAEVARSSPDG